MIRLLIQLEETDHRDVKARSQALGISMSKYAVGAIRERLRKDITKMIANNMDAPLPSSNETCASDVMISDVMTSHKEKEGKGEGKIEKSPAPPLKTKGKSKWEEKEISTTTARARGKFIVLGGG